MATTKRAVAAATKRAREMEQSGPQSGHKIPRVVSGPDTSQAASRIEASRLRVAWNKELASEMLQKHEPRLLATSKEAALTQRELNSDISKHEINQRRIGNVKSFMRDMWNRETFRTSNTPCFAFRLSEQVFGQSSNRGTNSKSLGSIASRIEAGSSCTSEIEILVSSL